MTKDKLLKIINLFTILIFIFLGLYLLNRNFPNSEQLVVEIKPKTEQSIVTSLGPEPRIRVDGSNQIILEDPVYFDTKVPGWFNQLRVEIIFKENVRELKGISGKTGSGWQYSVKQPIFSEVLTDGFSRNIYQFDLNSLYNEKNVKRFVISTSGQVQEELIITSIKLIFVR